MVAIANSCLSGEVDAIPTCWKLQRHHDAIKELLGDGDRNTVVGIVSETDHLPVGELRANWHPDFVQLKLAQLAAYEEQVAPDVKAICKRLVDKIATVITTEDDWR